MSHVQARRIGVLGLDIFIPRLLAVCATCELKSMDHLVVAFTLASLIHTVVPLSYLDVTSTPHGHVPIAMNSNDLTSFNCTVYGGIATWELGGHQFSDRDLYREQGIIIATSEDLTFTNVSFSREGLDALNRSSLSIRCYVFNPTLFMTKFGEYSYIVRYGAPDPPYNLQLFPKPYLHLTWRRPGNLHTEAPVKYTVTIINMNTMSIVQHNTTTQLNMDILLVSKETRCEPHSIAVVAWNEAGNSTAASIRESIPLISPDVTSISQTMTVSVDLNGGSGITITLSFQGAQGCSESYPVLNHTVVVEELASGQLPVNDSDLDTSSSSFTIAFTSDQFPGLAYNRTYTVHITACSSITCRQSESMEVRIVDIQSATVVFTHTDVYLSCVFTSGSAALGCQFAFSLASGVHSQTFNVSRSDKEACFKSYNQRDAYASIEVSTIDRDGHIVGVALAPNITENDSRSGCSSADTDVDNQNAENRNAGAVAGGIVAVVVVVVVVVGTVIAVAIIGYCWYKKNTKSREIEETDGNPPAVEINGVLVRLESKLVSRKIEGPQQGFVEVAQIKIIAGSKRAELTFVESNRIKLKNGESVIPLYTTPEHLQ